MGRFKRDNYKELFAAEVEKLTDDKIKDRAKRIKMIDELIEEYVQDTGTVPDSYQLTKLGSAILYEDTKGDSRPDKVTLEERPILTFSQIKRRQSNEVTGSIMNVVGSDNKVHLPAQRNTKGVS